MKLFKYPFLALLAVVLWTQSVVANEPAEPISPKAALAKAPHCEVPCGIYTDQLRFEQMLEDTKTIAKAIDSIVAAGESMGQSAPTAKGINQTVRWVTTKENHCTNTQQIIAQYFMTQRIKADKENYVKQLTAAHKVMVSAMKCKQDANPETAKTLKNAIYDLYRVYEGKEPDFHDHK